jgi:hypothetical protein
MSEAPCPGAATHFGVRPAGHRLRLDGSGELRRAGGQVRRAVALGCAPGPAWKAHPGECGDTREVATGRGSGTAGKREGRRPDFECHVEPATCAAAANRRESSRRISASPAWIRPGGSPRNRQKWEARKHTEGPMGADNPGTFTARARCCGRFLVVWISQLPAGRLVSGTRRNWPERYRDGPSK